MSDRPGPESPRARRYRLELLSTVLLAIAAVATAWSSYQATRWNGEQAKAASQANAVRIEASRAAGLGESETQIDVATFIAWMDAQRGGDSELAQFYEARFRPEFRIAFNVWIATNPLTNPQAPSTPFAIPEYRVAAKNNADKLDRAAEVSAAEARRNIQRSGNYVLTVVLYAIALFFGGMSNKVESRRLQQFMIGVGYVVLLTTLTWIATFPVTFSV